MLLTKYRREIHTLHTHTEPTAVCCRVIVAFSARSPLHRSGIIAFRRCIQTWTEKYQTQPNTKKSIADYASLRKHYFSVENLTLNVEQTTKITHKKIDILRDEEKKKEKKCPYMHTKKNGLQTHVLCQTYSAALWWWLRPPNGVM